MKAEGYGREVVRVDWHMVWEGGGGKVVVKLECALPRYATKALINLHQRRVDASEPIIASELGPIGHD